MRRIALRTRGAGELVDPAARGRRALTFMRRCRRRSSANFRAMNFHAGLRHRQPPMRIACASRRASADYTSLQSLRPSDVDAETFPTLRYRFANFPRTLELSLVFRTAENPEDVAVSLPWPGERRARSISSQIPQWRGQIVEFGFAQFPVAQLVPPAQGFKPFEIVEAGLWSRSWRGDLAALATDWFGAWPWTQRSVHALGRDTDTPRARSLVLCVAFALGICAGVDRACVRLARSAVRDGRRSPLPQRRGCCSISSGRPACWAVCRRRARCMRAFDWEPPANHRRRRRHRCGRRRSFARCCATSRRHRAFLSMPIADTATSSCVSSGTRCRAMWRCSPTRASFGDTLPNAR